MNTPENITHLKSNEVFVFGSNVDGIHAGGAAAVAYRAFDGDGISSFELAQNAVGGSLVSTSPNRSTES